VPVFRRLSLARFAATASTSRIIVVRWADWREFRETIRIINLLFEILSNELTVFIIIIVDVVGGLAIDGRT